MKLSKKNQARQRVIAKALVSGKALGGLLAGIAATTLTGCERHPFRTAGRPASVSQPIDEIDEILDDVTVRGNVTAVGQPNAANENAEDFVVMGEPPVFESDPPNKVNEKTNAIVIRTAGIPVSALDPKPKQPNATNETKEVWATAGDIAIEPEP